MDTPDPSLADDENALAGYAAALADAAQAVTADWIRRSVWSLDPSIPTGVVDAAATEGVSVLDAELRELLALDIADQRHGPLEMFRRGVRFATAVLAEAGVPVVERDEFAARNFPDDLYNLSPASFGSIDPSLHEPGLVWGAAKAHVHLRRRRDQTVPMQQSENPRVVVLATDLMDRSKIEAAYPEAVFVRSPATMVQEALGADLVIVDLNRLNDPGAIMSIEARVIAYGSHVDEAKLGAAADVGAEAMARSVFFHRLESGGV